MRPSGRPVAVAGGAEPSRRGAVRKRGGASADSARQARPLSRAATRE